jgi:hypothetical protein
MSVSQDDTLQKDATVKQLAHCSKIFGSSHVKGSAPLIHCSECVKKPFQAEDYYC